MTKPLVSVVIPTYNDGDTLHRAIDSVFSQTYKNIEITVVDDGSIDNTDKKMTEYEGLKYIKHEKNRGGSAARNTGIERSSGEYVAFLDADDEWLPEKIERQVTRLESRSEEWIAAYCDKVSIDSKRSKIEDIASRLIFGEDGIIEGDKKLIPRIFMMEIGLGSSTLLVKKNIVDQIGGFDTDFRRHQDLEFVIRLLRHGKMAYVNEKLVKKYGSNKPSPEIMEGVKEEFISKFSEDISELEQEGYPITDRHMLQLTSDYLQEGRFKDGYKHLTKSHLTNPEFMIRLYWSFWIGVMEKVWGNG